MSNYWERRQVENMYRYMQNAEDVADQISQVYYKASRYLSFMADEIFEKYQTKYGMSEAEAGKLISSLYDKTSIDEMLQKLQSSESTREKEELRKHLEAPAYQARIDRLRQIQNSLDYIMDNVYQQEKQISTSFYVDLANEAYYRQMFAMQQQANAAFSFSHISKKQIDHVIHSKWSGKNYSERIWGNTNALAQDLKQELLLKLVTGKTNREVAGIISNKYAVAANIARRLVRTESNYLSTQMGFKSYEECGIEEYQYLATLDLRTSKVCRELDGKIFKVKERKVGVNCPPMHPWCRSTTISVVDRSLIDKMQRSAIDPTTGKRIKVPRSMNYEQWYEKYVKGKPEAEHKEQKIKNKSEDQKQYDKYRKILGEDAPKTLDDFQDMKYNDSEKWKEVKAGKQERLNRMEFSEMGDLVEKAWKQRSKTLV